VFLLKQKMTLLPCGSK